MIILSVLYYGGSLVTSNVLSVGNLASFVLYAAYVGIGLNGISSFYAEVMKGLGASARIFEIVESHADDAAAGRASSGSTDRPNLSQDISVKGDFVCSCHVQIFWGCRWKDNFSDETSLSLGNTPVVIQKEVMRMTSLRILFSRYLFGIA